MKSLLGSVRADGGHDRADRAAELLNQLREDLGAVSLEHLWSEYTRRRPTDGHDSLTLLVECIKVELRTRFGSGQSPRVTEYLERFPQLEDASSRVLSLIYEEYCLVEQRGDGVNVDSFCERYPAWKDSFVSQLQYHRLFSQATGLSSHQPNFPEPGQDFEEFHLLSVLGKGGTSRVFLASDLALGGKQVVLKVSLDRGQEPLAQGALDHPHIVPVNSVVFDQNELRGLSMPYRPGCPLDEIIKDLGNIKGPRRAIDFWNVLISSEMALHRSNPDIAARSEPLPALPRGDGWAKFPIRGTFAQGAAWIVMIIARSLSYAHERRTFHRDVKPGNVLLTIHHGPQLFDFNLAASPHTIKHAELAMNGGTLPYMAPEQIHAFIIPELWKEVHAPADIYSLGLVLRELLIGVHPELPAPGLSAQTAIRTMFEGRRNMDISLRRHDETLPVALEAIVARCLAFAPEDRYPTATALAEDLERFLDRRPLKTAVNRSRRERSANWCRRNRLALGVAASISALALIPLAAAAYERLKPPIEQWGAFRAGIRALESHDLPKASQYLQPLDRWYHSSPRLQLALALLAHESDKDHARASQLFQSAAPTLEAASNLVPWVIEHAPLAGQLINLARNCLEQEIDADHIQNETRKILSIVLAADSKSHDALQLLARCEEQQRNSSAAYEAITSAMTQAASPDIAVSPASLFDYRLIHIRLATKLATDLYLKSSPANLAEALKFVNETKKSLQICERYVGDHVLPVSGRYFHAMIKLEAILVRAEIELGLGQNRDASRHVQDVELLFKDLPELAALNNVELPDKVKLWRVRSRKIQEQLRAHQIAAQGN